MASTTETPHIQGSIFEGLFLKGVGNDPALHEKLRAVGFDARRLEPTYHPNVFDACLQIASKHLYPNLSPAEGLRRLGKSTTDGYRSTLAGSVVTAALKMLGPARLIKQLPSRFRTGTNFGNVEVREVEPRHWQLTQTTDASGVAQTPEFVAGAVEAAMELTGVTPQVTIASRTPYSFVLDLRWAE